ncbi:MAG: protein-disulfide reductase DsbD domain-containing protein, partial [Flavobacteriales bacterium]
METNIKIMIFRAIALLLLLTNLSFMQQKDNIQWEFSSRKNGDITEIVMTANLTKGWHIYSQFTPDGGPIPTEFKFDSQKGIELMGKVKEPNPEKHYDPNFQLDVMYFSDNVEFVQQVRTRGSVASIKGTLSYMMCNDKTCLPPK